MPTIKIHNRTSATLNLALSHLNLCPFHFENSVKSQDTWSVHVSSVWFAFECRPDTAGNEYSASKSARNLGLIISTLISVALVAVPLTVSAAASVVGPLTAIAHLAGNSMIVAGASSQVLPFTTLSAATLCKKTIYQLSVEHGVKGDALEEVIKNSAMLIDRLKYATLCGSLGRASADLAGNNLNPSSEMLKNFPLLAPVAGDFFDYLDKMFQVRESKTYGEVEGICQVEENCVVEENCEVKENCVVEEILDWGSDSGDEWIIVDQPYNSKIGTYERILWILIGFKNDYEFEWRDKLNRAGEPTGVELWDLKSNLQLV